MRLSESRIEEHKRMLRFNESDAAALSSLHSVSLKIHNQIIHRFYAHLTRFDPTAGLIDDPSLVERLKEAQSKYFSGLLSGNYDADYVANRLRVGEAHHRVGLGPHWYLGAYCTYLRLLLPEIEAEGSAEFPARLRSLIKIAFFDMGLAVEAYRSHRIRSVSDEAGEVGGIVETYGYQAPHHVFDEEAVVSRLSERQKTLDSIFRGFLDLGREDALELRAMVPNLGTRFPDIAKKLMQHHSASVVQFSGENGAAALEILMRDLQSLTTRNGGEYTPEHRFRAGVRLINLRIPLWAVIGFFGNLLVEMSQAALKRGTNAVLALLKVICFDLGLLIDAYVEAEVKPVQDLKDYAENVLASLPSGMAVLDRTMTVRSANHAFAELVGKKPPDLAGRTLLELFPTQMLVSRAHRVLNTNQPEQDIFFDMGPGERENRVLRGTVCPMGELKDGSPGLLILVEDVTEIERLRRDAHVSEHRFRDLIQGLNAIVFEFAPTDFRFRFVNEGVEAILGYRARDWIEDPGFFSRRIHPGDRERVLAAVRDPIPKDRRTIDFRMIASDDSVVWLQSSWCLVSERSGRKLIRAVSTDISALKSAESRLAQAHRRILDEQQKLIQAEKLSSIGLLASGVAHEINNPLSGVLGCVKSLRDGRVSETRRGQYYSTVIDGLERIQATVKGLLDFARRGPLKLELTELAEVTGMALNLVGPVQRKKGIRLSSEIPSTGLRLLLDRVRITQGLVNLLLNATYSVEERGSIDLVLRRSETEIGVAVRDDGAGIPVDQLDRVCDPFFTTKPEGEGTGLGLAITRGIAESHGGRLVIENNVEKGATAVLWLPLPTGDPDA